MPRLQCPSCYRVVALPTKQVAAGSNTPVCPECGAASQALAFPQQKNAATQIQLRIVVAVSMLILFSIVVVVLAVLYRVGVLSAEWVVGPITLLSMAGIALTLFFIAYALRLWDYSQRLQKELKSASTELYTHPEKEIPEDAVTRRNEVLEQANRIATQHSSKYENAFWIEYAKSHLDDGGTEVLCWYDQEAFVLKEAKKGQAP